jgi:acyl-coenzyme A thioesterase PaaI-like protein
VFFGPGLEGWPSFVHGGAISVVLDESLGRVALRSFPGRAGVTANLNINYRAPVISSNFYTVHAKCDHEKSSERKAYLGGSIRDLSGNICAEATGLFVVPKTLKLNRLKEVNSA